MRIVPYSNNDDLDNIESMAVIIKAIPFEDSFVPTFFLNINSEDHPIDLDELNALMDGLEIAMKHVDSMINWLIRSPSMVDDDAIVPPEMLEEIMEQEDEDEEEE
jgi:hypothetical protein